MSSEIMHPCSFSVVKSVEWKNTLLSIFFSVLEEVVGHFYFFYITRSMLFQSVEFIGKGEFKLLKLMTQFICNVKRIAVYLFSSQFFFNSR